MPSRKQLSQPPRQPVKFTDNQVGSTDKRPWSTKLLSGFTPDQIEEIRVAIDEIRFPTAKFTKAGRLKCRCGHTDFPGLLEVGYYLRHHVKKVTKEAIEASGGDSGDFGEDGETYHVDCQKCFAEYSIPEGFGLDFG